MSWRRDSPVKPVVGDWARLRRRVERFPHFQIETGATGMIIESSDSLIAMKMDDPVTGAEEWENELCWTEDVVSAGQLIVAFFDDVQITYPGTKEKGGSRERPSRL